MASVKVAVRVRPFNQREIELGSNGIIRMDSQKTAIINPKIDSIYSDDGIGYDKLKEFTFDYSYWSVDRDEPGFATQELIYNNLGRDVVTDAFEGYNSCIFAYGQTGSGKTYTMMGTPDSEGLIPRICRELFTQMKSGRSSGATYRTEVSYLEIYNEHVKDLLSKHCHTQNLRVREHPKNGPYVQDLSKHLVQDYGDLQELMNKGNAHRTTAATCMNDTSSRSHAIFTITFSMASFSGDTPRETLSKVNLVDLAGSERATTTKAEGQRLIEGGHINKSLVTLGSVISALAEMCSNAKKKQCFIPYRDSVLTWLLKDSLGGNSKTIMIATISPADCNYGETLSTLRYANRAKNIINKPTINEDTNTKLIRELRAEIERLKTLVGDHPTMLEKVHENEAKVKILTEEWTGKWKETHKILKEQRTLGLRRSGFGIVLDSDLPHLVGIDDDVLSTGIILYHLKDGITTIGTEFADKKQDIILYNGVDVEDEHCVIELKEGVATLIPLRSAVCYVNTILIDKPSRLSQGCVIVIGQNNMFRFNDPLEVERLRREKEKGSTLNLSKMFSRSSDMFRSCDNLIMQDNNNSSYELELISNKINEKRKQIDELETQYKLAEDKRRQDQITADQQLKDKRLELERLKFESEKLRLIIEESQLIIKSNDRTTDAKVIEDNNDLQNDSIGDMLSAMKDKTLEARERVAEVLSAIRANSANQKESLHEKNGVLISIYDALTEKIDEMANEGMLKSSYVRNNLYDSSTAIKTPIHVDFGRQQQQTTIAKCNNNNNNSNISNNNEVLFNNLSSDIENSNLFTESYFKSGVNYADFVTNELIPIRKDIEKILLIAEDLKIGDTSAKTDAAVIDENSNIEANLIELRLNELQQNFEKNLSDLQRQFEQQRQSFEDQRSSETQKLVNERKRLQELEEAHISAIVEHEVQRRLQLQHNISFGDSSWVSDLECRTTPASKMYLNSSPLLSPSRSLYSIPSLSNIIETSLESSIGSTRTTGDNHPPNTVVIIIPSYSLRGSGLESHYEYEIKININGEKWTIYRRYKRFRELHHYMKQKYGHKVRLPYFPPRKFFNNKSEKLVESRRRILEYYLQELVAVCQPITTCPLNYKAFGSPELCKQDLCEFSQFFQKGCFEVSKHFTA